VEWQLAQATVKASLLKGDKQELQMKLAAAQQESADLRAQVRPLHVIQHAFGRVHEVP
jgi:hypothetical protein